VPLSIIRFPAETALTEEFHRIAADLTGANVMSPPMLERLRGLTLTQREEIARLKGTITVYFDAEVTAVRKAEEEAVLKAMPGDYPIEALNGINIGCGDRSINPALLAVDITRQSMQEAGGHAAASSSALLALADDLPFLNESIDFIVALHMLEHVVNPIRVLDHWLDKLKPGGGIGLILPNWHYTWNAAEDEANYGHKWNAEPNLVSLLWERHLSHRCVIEALDTYPFKLSFDVIFRKIGVFKPFAPPAGVQAESGASRKRRGAFLSLDQTTIIV
jgi:SAM-dependent methyltransferase